MPTPTILNDTNVCSTLAIEQVTTETPFKLMMSLQRNLQERLSPHMFVQGRSCHQIGLDITYWNYCLRDELTEVHEWFPFDTPTTHLEASFEIVDALHFLNNIALELGFTDDEIEESVTQALDPNYDIPTNYLECEKLVTVALNTLMKQIPWKKWRSYSDSASVAMSKSNIVEALAHVYVALVIYAQWFGISSKAVAELYLAKHRENHARQDRMAAAG